jgi:hypothetical protein
MGDQHTESPKENSKPANADKIAAPAKTPARTSAYYPSNGLNMSAAASTGDIPITRSNIMMLQRTVGNRAVSQLLQKKAQINEPRNHYERGADQPTVAAGQLQLFTGPAIQRKCACANNTQGPSGCADCDAKKHPLQRPAAGAADQSYLPSSVTSVLQSNTGEPLPKSIQANMEGALGANLGKVSIHRDSHAALAAEDINAEAFTAGQDIYFGAGRYAPETKEGKKLLAHELVHTIQQGNGGGGAGPARSGYNVSQPGDPQEVEAEAVARRVVDEGGALSVSRSTTGPNDIHRYSFDEFLDDVESAGETVGDVPGDVVDAAGDVAEAVVKGGEAVGDAVVEGAEAVGDAVVEGTEAVVEAGSEAVDWLATEVGQLASEIAAFFGVDVRITSRGLEIDIPPFCPIDAMPFRFTLPSIEGDVMVPIFALPVAPDVTLTGEVGLAGSITPEVQIQVGPVCVNGIHALINPITNDYSISGSISATAALGLGAEVRGGVRGQLGLTAIIPIGPVPVPITFPLVGVEGGLAGIVRGIGAGTLTIGGGFGLSGSTITLSQSRQLDLGVAADLFLGAYAQLDIAGKNFCRIYWQPYEWHGDMAASLTSSLDLMVTGGSAAGVGIDIGLPTMAGIPFDQIPLAISREGFSDDCPILDQLCGILTFLGLLPSLNGGVWDPTGPYGPGNRLDPNDPLGAYERKPAGRASGAECRGACGPDCETCKHLGKHTHTDPATGDVWEYSDFEDCDSHEGCRDHDAGFDWAADKKGEVGDGAIIMPWHMAANIECMCKNLGGNCIAWVAGLPPYDSTMYFATAAKKLSGPGASGACKEEHPSALDCHEDISDRDTVLEAWGAANGVGNFRDCRMVQERTPGLEACGGATGNVWNCTATDLPTGQDFTVSINECDCCKEDGTFASEWRQPEVVVTGDMSEELILSLCERRLIVRVICIPIEDEMIRRFGNRRRNIDLDPDTDPKTTRRLDDAPIFESFRKIYNRLDSWNFFIRAKHPELHPEFQTEFKLTDKRNEWLKTVKEETEKFKNAFRNLENQDVGPIQRAFEEKVLRTVQPEMEALNLRIAVWFKEKTGSSEPTDTIIERVHQEGTEIWREAWRKAILQVNRVLSLLWPPAKTRVLVFVGQKRAEHPDKDLSGDVGDVDYIGSLATGFKGPPKQQIRFNPALFDVDANLEAPPLAKYAVTVLNLAPDREKIFSRNTDIEPLKTFANETHEELKARVEGYDPSDSPGDKFDVAINTPELPTQERQRTGTDRIYELRDKLDGAKYSEMIGELKRENLVAVNPDTNRLEVRGDLSPDQFDKLTEILNRFEQGT